MNETTRTPALGEATIEELRTGLRGSLVTPSDPGYEEARRVWNGDIDRHPALIARCAGTADVIAALRFARSHGLPVAVRGGGHNVAGFGTCDGGVVLDLSPMKGIRVDPKARTARVEGGATWGELDHETQAFGLATTGGLVTSTGVAGFTLGGGIGWLMRKHGLASDNLLAADVVTADGELVAANAERDSELLWGLQGGGGNFGIVTSFEYRLHPVGPVVYGGALFHPAERAAELLRFYRDWVKDLPDELTTMIAFLTAPPEPFVPEELVGTQMVAVALCYAGNNGDGEASLASLRAFASPAIDVVGPIPYVALQGMFDNSAPHGINAYWKTEYCDELTDAAVDAIVERCAHLGELSPFSTFHLHHLGGAVSRVGTADSAFPHRRHPFVVNVVGMWTGEEARSPHVEWARGTWDALQPHTAGAPYLNFLGDEGAERVAAAYGDDTYARLVGLKDRCDPDNVFRLNQNIPPSA